VSPALVDVHAHVYPDPDEAARATASYEVWEYGTVPPMPGPGATGTVGELADHHFAHGFDHGVALYLMDTEAERRHLFTIAPEGADNGPTPSPSIEQELSDRLIAANRWLADQAAGDPRLSALVCVDPLLLPSDRLTAHVDDMADLGVCGVKLHPVLHGCRPADERLAPLWRRCRARDLLVLSHAGPGRPPGGSANPLEFRPVLSEWPDLRLVLAHLGGGSWQQAADLAAAHPHVVFDLSEIIEWVGAPRAPTPSDLTAAIRTIGADRIMLGSDFPWYDPAEAAERVARLPGLGRLEVEAVLATTAAQVFRLPG